jgi:hypothetical protein
MDNHCHLLLETPSGNLSQILRHINGAYTTCFKVKRARSGHLFQGRYKAILVDKDGYAKELSRYIHLNPVRAAMVKSPGAYPWSSYSAFTGKSEAPGWLHRDFILAYFGKKANTAQKRYREFVEALVAREYESPLAEATATLVLGSAEFVQDIKRRYLCGRTGRRNLPALRKLYGRVGMETILNLVQGALEERPTQMRNAAIYLCRKHTGETLRTIGKPFGISDAAVSQVCKRFEARTEKDRHLRKKIADLEERIKTLKVET